MFSSEFAIYSCNNAGIQLQVQLGELALGKQ
ncbi:hypothetical protein BH23THE1_BH23THE1_27970 [soil metagenome]